MYTGGGGGGGTDYVSIDIFHFCVICNICSIEYTMNLSLQKTFDALPLPSRLTLLVQSLRKQDASVEVSASAVQQLTSCAVCRALVQDASVEVSASAVQQLTSCAVCRALVQVASIEVSASAVQQLTSCAV